MSDRERNLRHQLRNLQQLQLSARYLLSSGKLTVDEREDIRAMLPGILAEAAKLEGVLRGVNSTRLAS